MIEKKIVPSLSPISSGSFAEGLNLPGSDFDMMYLINDVDIIQSVWFIKHPIRKTTMVMESDNNYPGFTRLRLVAGGENDSGLITSKCFESIQMVYIYQWRHFLIQ